MKHQQQKQKQITNKPQMIQFKQKYIKTKQNTNKK